MYSQSNPNFDRLYSLAERQQGYFTALQARQQGYSRQLHSYYVGQGHWIRVDRGIFRLKYFPVPIWQEHLYVVFLWTLNREGKPEGVYSHGTALYLHKLGTFVPPALDLTVPKHFRRHTSPGSLQLHKRTIDISEYEMLRGLPVTTPLRTIIDLLDTREIDYDYTLESLKTALDQFMILPRQIRQAKITPEQRKRLMTALGRVGYTLIDEI